MHGVRGYNFNIIRGPILTGELSMKVVCVNGSPHPEGNTYLTIKAFADELRENGVESEVIQVGSGNVSGCIACGGCVGSAACVVQDEQFKTWSDKLKNADGVFLAAPDRKSTRLNSSH